MKQYSKSEIETKKKVDFGYKFSDGDQKKVYSIEYILRLLFQSLEVFIYKKDIH